MFLVQLWRLEASSKPFYDPSKINLQQDMLIFSNWYVPFLIFSVHSLKREKNIYYSYLVSEWLEVVDKLKCFWN